MTTVSAKPVSDERGPTLRLRRALPAGVGRLCTLLYNTVMTPVPHGVKYGIGQWWRENRAPYRFLRPDDTVVQIGSARDILRSGRSRAIFLSRFIPQGKLILIEADTANQDAIEDYVKANRIDNIAVVRSGAWDKKTTLEFWSNPSHPASNLVREANEVIHEPVDETLYDKYEIEVDSVDNILEGLGVGTPRMVCITTNGSEPFILDGLKRTIAAGCQYLSLAPTGKNYIEKVESLGYRYIVEDDRGYFFEKIVDA